VKKFLGRVNLIVTAGRFNQIFGQSGFIMNLWGINGIKASFGNVVKVELCAVDFSNPLSSNTKGTAEPNSVGFYLYFKDTVYEKLLYNISKATALQGFYLKSTFGIKVVQMFTV